MRPSGIGGQAVLEGIMMKNKEKYSVAVRKPDGQIEVRTEVYRGIAGDSKWAKLPLIRGVVNFIDSLILGMESLSYSASFYDDEEEQEPGKFEKLLVKLFGEKAEKVVMGCTVAFSVIMAVAIFMVLPYYISSIFRNFILRFCCSFDFLCLNIFVIHLHFFSSCFIHCSMFRTLIFLF